MSWRTGEAETRPSTSWKSELASGRWKTTVLSSGVVIAFRPSLSLDVSLSGTLVLALRVQEVLEVGRTAGQHVLRQTRSMPYLTSWT